MARIVRLTERTPLVIPPTGKELRVCRCGLSKTFPLCDGACAATDGEDATLTYVYDAKGKRKVLEEGGKDDRKSLSTAWKWVLPVAYILVPANIITTVVGYMKLPAKYAKKGTIPGVSTEFIEKTPMGFILPILLQILLVIGLTWLSFHPQYANPQRFLEMMDTHVSKEIKDRFHLWTRRLIATVALLVSAFFTYISVAILYGALLQQEEISVAVVVGFAVVLVAVVATWAIVVRRNLRAHAAAVAAAAAIEEATKPADPSPPPQDAPPAGP